MNAIRKRRLRTIPQAEGLVQYWGRLINIHGSTEYDGGVTGDDFRQAQFRQAVMGYQTDEVDDYLERMASALDAGLSSTLLIEHAQFHWAVRGYAYEDVDQFLAQIVRTRTAIDVPARQLRPTSPPREPVGLWMTADESVNNDLWLVAP
jgi:DivIVA domain-containing protein